MTVVWAALGLCAGMCLCSLYGCGSAPTPVQQADVAGWTTADAACLAQAKSRAETDACYDANRRAYCGTGPDGGILLNSGACAHVRLSDGGQP